MLGKIITGIIIGFIGGFLFGKDIENDIKNKNININEAMENYSKNKKFNLYTMGIFLIALGFIATSFGAGIIYGLMAIGEIILGFYMAFIIFMRNNNRS